MMVEYLHAGHIRLPETPIEMQIDGTLDLHTFQPREVRELIPAYLESCRERNILSVRIVHGKGTGVLREIVHSTLKKSRMFLRSALLMRPAAAGEQRSSN